MLANPVVRATYAEPMVWVLALVAMAAEVATVLWLLRRQGHDMRGFEAPLFAIQFATWLPLLVALDRVERWPLPPAVSIGGLEAIVVLVEAALLHSATRGRVFTRGLPCAPLTWSRALLASVCGNLVSIAVSLSVPLLIFLLFGR